MNSYIQNAMDLVRFIQKSFITQRDGSPRIPDLLNGTIQDVKQVAQRGPPISIQDLPAYLNAVRHLGSGINDREFLLEKLIVLMSRLPDDSALAHKLQQVFIDILYKDLPHPPSSYLASAKAPPQLAPCDKTYIFRSVDGSNYNKLFPSLGQASQPYARSVPSARIRSYFHLPDPALVFDTLLCRDKFVPHPGGLSSLFFAFANLITHSIFDTDSQDWNINNSSSYLDLSILYGSTQKQVDLVRRKDGTGRLWNDVFADSRLLLMPPSVGALAILLCRNHNYIAEKILSINEQGHYMTSSSLSDVQCLAQCDEIFHRARLVNTGFFMQIILNDYVGAILGLVRDGLTWRLNPLESFREIGHSLADRGKGNVVSLEFNLLYRWHAAISVQDEEWLENLISKLSIEHNTNNLSLSNIEHMVQQCAYIDPDVRKWTLKNLDRQEDGSFYDHDLACILKDATESEAGAFQAQGVPKVMRMIEILGIKQARSWSVCSLNEFRKFIGLKPYSSFQEWNSNPKIYIAAKNLYEDIENLELYVGLQAEEAKPDIPGAGLCPGYTISRAILADAVCLTRGDRFFTEDFTALNLTTWGFQYCHINMAESGMITKLLHQTLPKQYIEYSTYTQFPFFVPHFIYTALHKTRGKSHNDYTWNR